MWRDPRAVCPKCGSRSVTKVTNHRYSCDHCKEFLEVIKCTQCKRQFHVCYTCDEYEESPEDGKSEQSSEEKPWNLWIVGPVIVILVGVVIWYTKYYSESLDEKLKRLKKDFPSQSVHTWSHVFSVLDQEEPSVKSITFLHGDDKATSDCLTKQLVSVVNSSIKMEDVVFCASCFEGSSPGHAFAHYLNVVSTFRVLVTDLTKLPGNMAKIFQSLCDEHSSPIKPSIFIFTLKFNESTDKPETKPLRTAQKILEESWKDLPPNIIHPLLTRVLRNVVEIKPEQGSC